jgi:type VI secretion system secreted protein Hcp
MAVDMFLKLDGIPGESQDSKHKEEIEIESFSWGLSNSGSTHVGGGAGAGKAEFQDLHFVSRVSKASPKLFFACASGQHVQEATITFRKAGAQQVEFLVYKLSDVLISSYQEGGSSGDIVPMDAFSLNFAKIEISYKEQKPDGSLGSEVAAGWDLKQVKAS